MTIWTPRIEVKKGPRYLAIAGELSDDVAAGKLSAGSRLPTHRDLAERLGVTVGTVSRAYAEAARRGLVSGEVGRGTFFHRNFLRLGREGHGYPFGQRDDLFSNA